MGLEVSGILKMTPIISLNKHSVPYILAMNGSELSIFATAFYMYLFIIFCDCDIIQSTFYLMDSAAEFLS